MKSNVDLRTLRLHSGLAGKSNCFKGSKKGAKKEKQHRKRSKRKRTSKEIDTVMIVPHILGDVLANKNPWNSEGCGCDNCFVCTAGANQGARERG